MHVINEDMPQGFDKEISVMPYEDAKSIYDSQKDGNLKFKTNFQHALQEEDSFGKVFLATTQEFKNQLERIPDSFKVLWGQGQISGAVQREWLIGTASKLGMRAVGLNKDMSEALFDATKSKVYEKLGTTEQRKRGQQLVITASRSLEDLMQRQQNDRVKLKDSHPILEGLISTGEQYGAAMLAAYVPMVGPALSLAYITALEASGTAVEGLQQYRQEHPEDKELKGFVADERATKEFALNTMKTFVNGVEEYILGPVGQARYQKQVRKLAEKGFKATKYGAIKYIGKKALVGGAQEFTEEGLLQNTSDTIFDYMLGRYKDKDEAVKAWKAGVAQAGFAALFGSAMGGGNALVARASAIEATREMLKNVVPEQDLDAVSKAVVENEISNIMDVATVALEINSQLNTQKGEIYDAFRNAAFKAAKESGGYKGLTDESLWAHINEVSERFSQEAVAEAFKRNVPIQEVLDSKDIVYKDGELHLAKADGESNLGNKIKRELYKQKKVKAPSSLLAFLINNGGIKDQHGELKALDAIKGRPGLVNNKYGLDLDHAREMAAEAGYLGANTSEAMSNTTISDLLDAIDRELRGDRVYSINDQAQLNEYENQKQNDEEVDTDYIEHLLDNKLEEYNVDYNGMTYEEKQEAYQKLLDLEMEDREKMRAYEEEQDAELEKIFGPEEPVDILFQERADNRDLIVYHSITENNLKKALDFGGLAVPSLAITKSDIPFDFSGSGITLVGNKQMIDPSRMRNEVYDRDVWSKTFPFPTYKRVLNKQYYDFKNKVKPFFDRTGKQQELGSLLYPVENNSAPERAVSEFVSSLGAKLMYVENVLKEKVDIPTKDKKQDVLKEIEQRYGIKADEKFVEQMSRFESMPLPETMEKEIYPIISSMIDRMKFDGKEKEYAQKLKDSIRSVFYDENKYHYHSIEGLLNRVQEYINTQSAIEPDSFALREVLDKKITDREKYEDWAEKYIEDNLLGEKVLKIGNRYLPFTLENVVKDMTRGITKNAQESFVYGSGKVIAAAAERLSSIKEIKEASKRIISEEQENSIKKQLEDDMNAFTNEFMTSQDFTNSMFQKEAAYRALGTLAENRNPTKEALQKALNYEFASKETYDNKLLEAGVKIAKNARELARHYFEAKPQRAVKIEEFSGAIVPTKAEYDEISQRLAEKGLKVVRSDNQLEAVKQFEDEFFQVQGLGKNKDVKRGSFNANSKVIKLFENANTSTLPHELSHYWLDNMWNYANSGNASPQYVAQFNAVKEFLGVKPEQENLTRAQHEKFASAYEKYLYRGEFPKPIIGVVFDNYERFIRDVYQSINDIRAQGKSKVRLTPEIIQFFDSMISGELPTIAENANVVNEARAEEVHQYDSKIVEEVKKEIQVPVEAPTQTATTQEILPVGSSGEIAESRFAKRSEIATGIETSMQYERANMEKERQKAAEMWKNDPQKAQAELNNATIGNDVLRSALYTEQQRIALENGDTQTYLKSVRKQSAEATRAGQEIAALRGVMEDITMPTYWIRLAEWEAQKQLAKNMATYFDKVMGNTPLMNFTQKFDADVKALYEKVKAAKTNAEKSQIMKDGLEQMKKTYRGLNQQELGELYQTDWTNEELAYDYVEKKARDAVGLNLSNEKANAIIQASRDLDKLSRKVDEFGIPTADFFAKKSELEYMINSHTPSSQTKVLLSTLGRANMLTAPATSVLNVASNVQNFGAQKIVRMLNNKITGHTNENLVDKNLQKQYRKRVWDTFWATGYDLAMMNDITDTRLYRGESAVNSAGEGVIRQAGQWAEKHIFGELISSPDMVFKSYLAFTDFAGNEATDVALKEGLSGEKAKTRANELFTDAIKIEPKTEIGKQIRAKAQADALVITFQQDTRLARTLLDLRNLINKATGDIGVGDLLSAFVKTPANVLALGYDATVGPFGHLINTFGAIQDARAGNLNSARVMATLRQTTTMAVMQAIVAAFALGFIDDDDYIPDYSQLSPSERLIVKERGGSFGSIRIGDTYISTDFFGPFELPLTAWLNARRQDGFAQSASAYIGSVIRKGMDAPVIKDLMDQAKAAEEVGSDSLSIWEHIYDTAGNLLISRLTPNVMNTLAKMSDDYERETNRKVLNKLISRIPFARKTLAPKMSVSTGKPVETPSALMQLLFGSRAHRKVDSAVADELYRLYQQGERATISDITRSGDLKLIDEKDKQGAKDWFAREYSSAALKAIKTADYKRKSDEEKKNVLNKIRRDLVKQLKEKHKNKISVAKQKK